MNNSTDNNQPIRNLQRALRRLSAVNEGIPDVVVDGQYGPETTRAVRGFQAQFGLPNTGDADPETYKKIMEEYEKHLKIYTEGRKLDVFPSPFFTIDIDDSNEIVFIVQAIMAGLANRFKNLDTTDVTGVYNEGNADFVREIQRISGLPQTGIVDKQTWDAMVEIYESNISKSRIAPFDKDSDIIIKRDTVLYAPFNNDDYRL